MDVVFHPSDFMNENPLLFANTSEIGPKARLSFCANELDWIMDVAVGHVSRLRRSTFISTLTHGCAVGHRVGAPPALGIADCGPDGQCHRWQVFPMAR